MTIDELRATLSQDAPPDTLGNLLQALWYDASGDWDRAHQITQDESGDDACRVHAYLHRKEGDLSNASYWYRRASQPVCATSLEQEWASLATRLLSQIESADPANR